MRNGLLVSPVWCQADTLRGVALGGVVTGRRLGGVLVGLAGVGGELDGTYVCEQASGLVVSPCEVRARSLSGLVVGGYVRSRRQQGLAVAALNRTDELHGVQLGLLNYAGNNPPGLRWLPLLGLHLRRAGPARP